MIEAETASALSIGADRRENHRDVIQDAPAQSRVIEPSRPFSVDWGELWRFRDLLLMLMMRDIRVRYKQAVMGAGWAIIQPLMTMLIFTLFFGKLGGMEHKTGGTPYAIYVLAALLPWTFFSTALTNCTNVLVGSYELITKVYFPRVMMPIATVMAGLVDFAVSMLLFAAMAIWYHVHPNWHIVSSLIALVGLTAIAVGLGSMAGALTVEYRDFRYVTPFVLQMWMFVTPVIYPTTVVPYKWHWIFSLNPMVGLIDGFRAGLVGSAIPWAGLGGSLAASAALLFVGLCYFRSVERRFADII